MDNGAQSNRSTPLPSNPAEARTNMYFFQVKPNNVEGSLDTESIPLQMLINEQDAENERYLISVVQGKHLQLIIDPREQYCTSAGLQINNDVSNSLQILNNLGSYENSQTISEQLEHSLPELVSNSIEVEKKESNKQFDSQLRKVTQKFGPMAGMLLYIRERLHISDRAAAPRAVAVLPAALRLRRAAVSPRRPLPARVRFGPVEGISRKLSVAEAESLVLESTSSRLPLFLVKTDDAIIHIDGSDKDKSNWLSLLSLGDQSTANVWLRQEDDKLYALTTQPIAARTTLALGYSKEYADTHRIPEGQPVLDLDAELTNHRKWWCAECRRCLPSAALLQRHAAVHRLEEKQRSQQRYRCKHCTRTFCRLFTLRRHVSRHCTSKDNEAHSKKSAEAINGLLDCSKTELEILPELSLNTTNADDSRLPSDESLQTLTNNLDFSTNLFDTDRMPNLDISGSSRSDTDFPYSLGLKDDIGLANSIEFPIEADNCKGEKEVKSDAAETVFLNCRHCDQAVVKGRQRQHVKCCPGRKFQCECGRAFPYKDKLALHIHLDHGNDLTAVKEKHAKELDSQQYRCETCKHTFKRRGMLVNHLWRVHAQAAAGVPLERRERVFPCAACPKLYRTAAKRARHASAHHPDCPLPSAPALERGRRACEPAACAACPRQYATRAKLLQHVRARHPLLAPPVKRNAKKK